MKAGRHWMAVLLCLGLLPQKGAAAEAVSVQVEPQEIQLGEPAWLTVRVKGAEGVEIDFPTPVKLTPFVELDRERSREMVDDVPVDVLRLKITTFEEVGDLAIPAMALTVTEAGEERDPFQVPEVQVKVKSLLEGVEQPEPRDVAGPVSIAVSDYRLLVYLALAILWLLMVWVFRLRGAGLRVEARLEAPTPSRPAHEIALEKLHAVVEEDLLRQGRIQEYFVRISEAVREYLGNRFGFFALDLTSRELLEELRDRPTPGLEHALLKSILEEADLVKFARLMPADDVSSRAIDGGLAIVENTRPAPAAEASG